MTQATELGNTEDEFGNPLIFSLMADYKNDPIYISFPAMPGESPCYISLSDLDGLRNYLKEVIKISEKLNKYGIDSVVTKESRDIDLTGPKVLVLSEGDDANEDIEEIEGGNLTATWEFYRNIERKSGSYILLSSMELTENSDSLYTGFKMRIHLDILKEVVNKLLSKNNINSHANSYRRNKEKDRNMLNRARYLQDKNT